MKTLFKSFMALAAVATAFVACNKVETELQQIPAEEGFYYTFSLGEPATKAVLDSDKNGRFVKWTSGDQLGSITTNSQGYSNITPATAETPAQFQIYSTNGLTEGNTINVWFPYRSKQTDATKVELQIPNAQTQRSADNEFDFKAMPMVAKQVTVTADMVTESNPSPISNIDMEYLGSVINFKVFSTNATYASEKVKSITFNGRNAANTADANIGGVFTKNLVTVDPENEETLAISSFATGYHSIVTSPLSASAIGTDKASALDLYMVIAPGEFSGTIVVATDAADYTYTLSAKTFVRGGFKAFGLDLGSATAVREADEPYTFTAQEFEHASSIAVGDKIIIANGTSGTVSVMKHYEGTNNNYKKVDADVVSSTITSTEDMAVLTVGGEAGNLTLFDPATELYVNATNTTSKNYLKSSETVDEYAKWNITFSASAAVISNTGKNSHNVIRYNSAIDQLLFSAYDGTTQQKVYIFKQAAPKVLDHISLSGTYPTEFFVGDAFDYTGLVVTAHYTNGKTATVTPTSVSSPDMSAKAIKTVTVSYTENEVTKTATYDINITERGKYTVTLADDSSELEESTAGAGVVLPTRSAIGDYTFYGWSETEVDTETSTVPTLVTIAGGKYYPTEDIILYPVYTKGSETTGWVKTALDAVTEGVYIIYNQNGAPFNGNLSKGHGECVDETITFSGETATSIPSGAIEITFISVTGGFKLYNADKKGYLYATKAGSGGLAWHNSENSYWCYNNSNWTYNSNNAYLRSYGSNATGIRTYGANNGDGTIQLIKKTTVSNKVYNSAPTE